MLMELNLKNHWRQEQCISYNSGCYAMDKMPLACKVKKLGLAERYIIIPVSPWPLSWFDNSLLRGAYEQG